MPPSTQGVNVKVTGLDELIRALRRFGKPGHLATLPLETELARAFAETQTVVHVISGRLKASGRTRTTFDGSAWTGAVEYGGIEGTPAYYAVYEMARGGSHDFLRPMDALDLSGAMTRWFEETLG